MVRSLHDHLMVQSLCLIDPANAALALGSLPHEILLKALDFAREYRSDSMVSNYGTIPEPEQIEAAKNWIEAALRTDPVATGNR